jgi:DNA-binding MarR family transcriptional regulator
MESKVKQTREGSFGLILRKIFVKIDRQMEQELQKIGLSTKLFGVLMILLEKEGLTQAEIGAIAEIPGYVTTRTLDTLENMGLLERRPHPTSRRSHQIFLTKKGKGYRKSLPAIIKKVNQRALSPLDKQENEQLLFLLKKILEAA